jgi:phosphate:Na+ symporter
VVSQDHFLILGGIGLFLFGMKFMTDSLRAAAGGRLRAFLTRFTQTPLTGAVTGAAVTALIQSSSATTVMTVGFVGAGLITFPHAIGVIFGANIGTTFTGWMITLLGFKLHLGTIALPGILIAALTALLAQGHLARLAGVVAGLCLIFIGLDMMQAAAEGFSADITPDRLPGNILLLVGLGLGLTVIMQSSSAVMALALVFVGSAALRFDQAAALIIGTNIGTTITALMASIGGSRTMRQTAVANLLFNLGTAGVALLAMALGSSALATLADRVGGLTALVLFHTAFNVTGAALFLPFTAHFADLVARLIPDREAGLTAGLDTALLKDEGAAMDAAQAAITRISSRMFGALAKGLSPGGDLRDLSALQPGLTPALEELEAYIARITIPDRKPQERARHAALLHQIDHIRRFLNRAQRKDLLPVVLRDRELQRPARYLGVLLARAAQAGDPAAFADRLAFLQEVVMTRATRHRRASLLQEHVGLISVEEMFQRTDGMRWLTRLLHHVERIAHYHRATRPEMRAPATENAAA